MDQKWQAVTFSPKTYQQTKAGGQEIHQDTVKLSDGCTVELRGSCLGTSWTHQNVTGKIPAEEDSSTFQQRVLGNSLGSFLGSQEGSKKMALGILLVKIPAECD